MSDKRKTGSRNKTAKNGKNADMDKKAEKNGTAGQTKKNKKNKTVNKAMAAAVIAAAAVVLFFVSALIYNAFVKDKGDKSGGITLGGNEKGFNNSVVLGEYRGIKYSPLEVEVTDSDVDAYISEQLKKEPNWEIDYSRDKTPVAVSDKVQIKYTLEVNGITYDSDKTEIYECGSNYFGESFDAALAGMIVGESSEAEITVPEDYGRSSIKGADGKVSFSVIGVVNVYDYLTDGYCARITDGNSKTVEDYRNYCRAQLEKNAQNAADEHKWNSIWETLRDSCELTIDEKSVEREYQEMIEYYQSYASYLNTTMEALVTEAYGYGTVQDFYDYCREYSRTVVEERIIYDAIIKKENITVDDETYKRKLAEYMEEAGYTDVSDFEALLGKEKITEMIESDMVSEILIDSAVAEQNGSS